MDWLHHWAPLIFILSVFAHALLLNVYRRLLHRDDEQQRRYLRELAEYVNRIEAVRRDPAGLISQTKVRELERLKRL